MLAGLLMFSLLQPEPKPLMTAASQEVALQAVPLTDLNGQESIISDWGNNLLVINFWAPWCLPCRQEVPTLIAFQNEYADRGVQVLGIAFDGAGQVRLFADEYQINYPLFLAANSIPMYNAAFGNPSASLPFTAILDRSQKILFRHNGVITQAQLREQLEHLL